jgi:hypothetical protein
VTPRDTHGNDDITVCEIARPTGSARRVGVAINGS